MHRIVFYHIKSEELIVTWPLSRTCYRQADFHESLQHSQQAKAYNRPTRIKLGCNEGGYAHCEGPDGLTYGICASYSQGSGRNTTCQSEGCCCKSFLTLLVNPLGGTGTPVVT